MDMHLPTSSTDYWCRGYHLAQYWPFYIQLGNDKTQLFVLVSGDQPGGSFLNFDDDAHHQSYGQPQIEMCNASLMHMLLPITAVFSQPGIILSVWQAHNPNTCFWTLNRMGNAASLIIILCTQEIVSLWISQFKLIMTNHYGELHGNALFDTGQFPTAALSHPSLKTPHHPSHEAA